VDRILIRNYAVFVCILTLCTGALLYVLVSGDRTIEKIDSQVTHTYDVINNAQELSALIEGMLASERGYLLTRDEKFMDKYRGRRDRVSEVIVGLSELTRDNKSQTTRLDELRHHFNAFSVKLEQRAQTFTITSSSQIILDDLEEIDGDDLTGKQRHPARGI
jgi:CHASE3 domain sensor protein